MLPQADRSWTRNEAAHLLNRAGFGGDPADVKALHALGRKAAVESLLSPQEHDAAYPLPAWADMKQALADFRDTMEKRREFQKSASNLSPEQADKRKREFFQAMQKENRQNALEGQSWWFRRMLTTKDPLREKMTLFWHDHFATSIQKVKQPVLMIRQNELFREHAFGSFQDLTQAILMDPAMMLYLDTQSSRKGKPNENFAREVMELFTLGEGHYTEEDVHEAARAFTGYALNRFTGEVAHYPRQWDETNKTVFGKTGPFNGQDVINLIFEQEQPARFMARKVWEYFVYENPPDTAIDMLAKTYRKSGYQMTALLGEIFLSKEFYSESAIRSQIKSPIQYLISLLKQLDIKNPPVGFPITAEQQLGQVLFMPPNVAGWDWGQAWINTNTLLARYNLAGFITKGAEDGADAMKGQQMRTPGMAPAPNRMRNSWNGPDYEKIAPRPLREDPAKLVDALVFRFFQGPVPSKARDSFIEYATAKKGAVFTNREVAELCHLMLSTPYYQLC